MRIEDVHIPVWAGGLLLMGIACVDAWHFHAFGLDWDKTVIGGAMIAVVGASTYVAGVKTAPPPS
jgi:hypothetical protein